MTRNNRFALWTSRGARRAARWVLALWVTFWVGAAVLPCCQIASAAPQPIANSDLGCCDHDDGSVAGSHSPVPAKCASLTSLTFANGGTEAPGFTAQSGSDVLFSVLPAFTLPQVDAYPALAQFLPVSPPPPYLRNSRLLI